MGTTNMSTANGAQKVTMSDAFIYLKAVKESLQDSGDKYDEFMTVMRDFKDQRVSTMDVISKVKELFKGNKDLILGFNNFLPRKSEITLPSDDELLQKQKADKLGKAMSFITNIRARFQGNDKVQKTFLDILMSMHRKEVPLVNVCQEVSRLFDCHNDLLVDFAHFLPGVSGDAFTHTPQHGDRSNITTKLTPTPVEKKPAYSFMSGQNANSPDKEKLDDAEKLRVNEEACKYEWELKYHQVDDPKAAFCGKVKEVLQGTENYVKMLDCIRSYRSKFFTASQFRKLVASVVGKHPDLMVACEDFITHIEKTGGSLHSRLVLRSHKLNGDVEDYYKDDKYENCDQDNQDTDMHDRDVAFPIKDFHGQKMPSYRGRDKFIAKSIQDLDLSSCESCTPSYRRLPDNYQLPSASQRTDIGDDVLNDHWVSVTSGSEDYSFKHMRKNQYEESLFRCEDDRFELDMLLESVNATVKRVEELVNRMSVSNTTNSSSFFIEEHLTAIHRRCIERLYGDHGLDVTDVLKKNVHLALPVILTRLKQKQEEWARCRSDFNKVWAEIYSRNYHKSLDHRSFYFKQQDTKNLSAKALLAEIKEMNEKNLNKDEMAFFMHAGVRQPKAPELEFEYSDQDIQEDLYQLIKHTYRKVCTPEQRDKVLIIWRLFLEPMLGLHVRSPCGEEKCVAADTLKSCMPQTVGVGHENNDNVGEAACLKTSDISRNKLAQVLNGHVYSSRMDVVHCIDNGVGGDLSLGADNIHEESGIVCIPHQNGNLDGGTASVTREESLLGDAASAPLTDVIAQVEKEPGSKFERESGESSPVKNIENVYEKLEQTLPRSGRSCGENEGEEAGDDEVEESAQGSSGSENALENADVSASESANGEDCSPDDLDDENDSKTETEVEADSIIDVHDAEGATLLPSQFLRTVKPIVLGSHRASDHMEKKTLIFYGNDSFYLLFRLHQMLYERMLIAKLHSASPMNKWKAFSDTHPADPYARFKEALHTFLDGSSDSVKYEENCRAIIGSQSYVLFTLDKLIHKLIKQIQKIAAEEIDMKLLQLYNYELLRNSKTFTDAVYHENARFLIPDDNLYRFEYFPCAKRLTIQLMRNEHGKLEPSAVSMDPAFASYLSNDLLSVTANGDEKAGMYTKRLKRRLYHGDENSATSKAMEGLFIMNNLEIKINCIEKKVSYTRDTADILYRIQKRKRGHGNPSLCATKKIKLPLDTLPLPPHDDKTSHQEAKTRYI